MTAFLSARRSWRRIKGPLALTLICAFVGGAYFGLTLAMGALPFFLWFDHSAFFWPLWFVASGAAGALAILWVLSIHFAPQRCYC